jgi:pyrroloquinoline-quinone synthase
MDALVARKSLLTHPFYQEWQAGTLTLPMLQHYAAQYYHHELAFPTYLSAIHTRTPHLKVRQHVLENLWDEEWGEKNHPALWLQFCEALGLKREDVIDGEVVPETRALISTMMAICNNSSYLEGLGAMYAYESQVPVIAEQKIAGLKQFYGIDTDEALEFFNVHLEADVAHSGAEADMIAEHAQTDAEQAAVSKAVDQGLDALWLFLDGVMRTAPREAATAR